MELNELTEFFKSLTEDNTGTSAKYGRNRLFNTKAMQEIVSDNNYLKNIYENMRTRGKDIFGYHFNEIILSMLFLKYVRSNKILFRRYLQLRKLHLHKNKTELENKKREKLKQDLAQGEAERIQQSTSGSTIQNTSNVVQPTNETLINETDSLGVFGVGGFPSTPTAFAKNVTNWRKFAKPLIASTGAKFIDTPLVNKSTKFIMENVKDQIDIDDINIKSINGVEPNVYVNELSNNELIINVIFKLFNSGEEFLLPVLSTDFFDFVSKIVIDPDNGLTLNEIIKSLRENYDLFINILKQYVLSEIDDSIEVDEESDLIEYQNNPEPKTINNMSDNKENINEEALPSALVKLNQIKKSNEKSLEDEINGLNKQIKDYFKEDQKEATPFEYDYDKDALKGDDIPMYHPSDAVQNHYEMDGGRGLEDIDYDIEPPKAFTDKIKQSIGEEKYKKVLQKAKLRKMEKLAARDVETEINDFKNEPSIGAKLKGLNESLTAKYTNMFGDNKFVTFNVNESTEVSKEDIENGSFSKLNYKGFGSLCEGKTFEVKTDILNTLDNFDFYINTNDNQIVFTLKESVTINESEIKKLKQLVNYDGGKKFLSNKINNKARILDK